MSAYCSDRFLVTLSAAGFLSALTLMMLSASSGAAYFAGGLVLFTFTVVMEGCATSLMSKASGLRPAGGGHRVVWLDGCAA